MALEVRALENLVIPYGIPVASEKNIDRLPCVEINKNKKKPLRLGHGPYDRNTVFEESSLLIREKHGLIIILILL
jgi:hypothetical protein